MFVGVEYGEWSVQLDLAQVSSSLSTVSSITEYQYPNKFRGYYWGPVIGYYDREQPINTVFKFVMPWVGIYSRSTYDYGSEKAKDRGKGMGYGLNIMPLKNIHLMFAYRTFTMVTVGFNDYPVPIGGNSLKTTEYVVGILIPLWLR
ncbi:MAG: hypothetical protein HQK49_14475 [Oligoflexia bacterium]|nr:hypothetical protein [Oligoflexia bacterium]